MDLKKCYLCDVTEEKTIILEMPLTFYYKNISIKHNNEGGGRQTCTTCLYSMYAAVAIEEDKRKRLLQ